VEAPIVNAPPWLTPGTGLAMPAAGAARDDWSRYAIARGMPADEAAGLSRDQLRIQFCPPGCTPGGEPDLELLERDPGALAARRQARRKPWEA
jgi:hypothetical protein